VLYDLDGTLLDTAADITLALNRAVAEFDWAPIAESEARRMIGRGGQALIERAAQAQQRELDPALTARMVDRFYDHYGALEDGGGGVTQPYEGAAAMLQRLHEAGVRNAVVTNKQHRFSEQLLQRLDLRRWVDLVIGGDSCARRKPDPQPLLYACETLGIAPTRALMVGDSINDVLAARGAKMTVICVTYGYNEGQDPRTLPCDGWIDSLAELPERLLGGALKSG
jgi:phosphoglycolate phosphatase